MQITSRLTIALQVFACLDAFGEETKITSEFLAASVNVNPVVIRRLLLQLKAAGLVSVARGSGGCKPAKPLEKITMLDVYKAAECLGNESLFHFHENPNPKCPVGKNIHAVLDKKLARVQRAMESEMKEIKLSDIAADTRRCIKRGN